MYFEQMDEMNASFEGDLNKCVFDCAQPGPQIVCFKCKKVFHQTCVKYSSNELNRAATWKCALCGLSETLPDNIIGAAHISLASLSETELRSPLISLIAVVVQRLHFMEDRQDILEQENEALRKKLARLPATPAESDLETVADATTIPKAKLAILSGNDVKLVSKFLRPYFPQAGLIEVQSHSTNITKNIVEEIKQVVETNLGKEMSIFLHPGTIECDLFQGDNILPAITEFRQWLSSKAPDATLTVISIPQVVKDACEKVNHAFAELSSNNTVGYIQLTHIQSDMLRRGERSYASDTAERIAGVLSRRIGQALGVHPKKQQLTLVIVRAASGQTLTSEVGT